MAQAALIGFQVAGAVAQGLGQRAEAMNEAARADAQARLADTQALQRDTIARGELDRFLSSVRAARAANGLSANSPNAQVLEAAAISQSDQERLLERSNYRQQAENFRTAASSYRSSAKWSLFTGLVNAAVPLAQYGVYKSGA
jgi:hypothetical protein